MKTVLLVIGALAFFGLIASACKTDSASMVKDAAAPAAALALPMPSDEVMAGFATACSDCHGDTYGNADKTIAWTAIVNGEDGSNPTHFQTAFQRLDWEHMPAAQAVKKMPKGPANQNKLTAIAGLRQKMLAALTAGGATATPAAAPAGQ